jgi:cytochrome c556
MVVGRRIEQITRALPPVFGIAALFCVGCGDAPLLPTDSTRRAGTSASSTASTASAEGPASGTASDQTRPTKGPSTATNAQTQPQPDDESERHVEVHTDSHGRKWLGDVPYDVFFDDPLAVAAEGKQQPLAHDVNDRPTRNVAKTPLSEKQTDDGGPAGSAERKAAAPDTVWQNVIDIDVLDAEVKRIRNELTAELQSVARYNGHYREIAISGATLAALGEIAAEHPAAVSWKQSAPAIRDLGRRIHGAASALGAQAYQATKAPYEQLIDVLDGNVPAGLPASEPQIDFAKVASREGLMKRMDHAVDWLKKGGGGPAQRLRKESANALREASLLAAFGRVIAVGHYDSADDEKYKTYAQELTKAAQGAVAGVKSEDAAAFSDAVGRVQKRCDACHADFRLQ